MYAFVIFLLFLLFIALISFGIVKKKKLPLITGILLAGFTIVFLWFMGFWGEKLWFDSLGYQNRFWTEFFMRIGVGALGFAVGGVFIYLFSLLLSGLRPIVRWAAVLVGALFGAAQGSAQWITLLKFFNQQEAGIVEPVLNKDASFYLFSLPFLDFLYAFFLGLTFIGLILSLIAYFGKSPGYFLKAPSDPRKNPSRFRTPGSGIIASGTLLLILFGLQKVLARYHLLYASTGVFSGPGWTDVNVRMPLYWIAAIISWIGAVIVLLPFIRDKFENLAKRFITNKEYSLAPAVTGVILSVFVLWVVILSFLPGLFQALLVEPNEITYEKPYIENNIKFTRHGFNLHDITEKEFPVSKNFSESLVNENKGLINNVRLWDWRALESVYEQFQEIRLYYEFDDIDIDRYTIDGKYRSVMVSAREMQTNNLPIESQTFVNKRFKYTHGYGIAMNTVNEFTDSGLPHLLIKDIPPQSENKELKVDRPEIYYGELTDSYVITNTKEKEFDYASGDQNKYVRYQGSGGVELSNFFRKLLYGWKFGGTKFLFSGYATKESRLMFNRDLQTRVKEIAPFLRFDSDPYITLIDGELKWIMDAYTTSAYFPYSQRYQSNDFIPWQEESDNWGSTDEFENINYIRNSVKAVIDPYSGDVTLYNYDKSDAIIQVWNNIFPDLIHSKEEMPNEIQKHVRYPANFLLIQGMVYAKYHMTDPEVFYNQEDLWVRATEKYYNNVKPVDPYYVMWERPNSDESEFVVMMPFTPKNKQVLIGWIAGMSDPENYGEFLSYKFSKEKRVLGTQQVETKIDQNSHLSSQLTLWDQRGSNVIRGNVLAIPIDDTILYVEPIYLQSETAAYPELRLVAVMHNDQLSYAETFEKALKGLYKEDVPAQPKLSEKLQAASSQGISAASAESTSMPESGTTDLTTEEMPEKLQPLIDEANNAFNRYFKLLGEKKYDKAAQELNRLENALNNMQKKGNR